LHRILMVEDDRDLVNITQIHIQHAGYETDAAYTCTEALQLLQKKSYDLILLDVLLPDTNGDAFCRRIRKHSRCAIIFMSCMDDSSTIVSALESGGDDYVVKPVKYDELLARISSSIRRYQLYSAQELAPEDRNIRKFKQFSIDTLRHRVLQSDEEVKLSSIEYSLLLYFADSPDTLLLYDDLYRHVWENESVGDVRTVMVHISNLRKKIDPNKTGLIETVRGAGYIFNDI